MAAATSATAVKSDAFDGIAPSAASTSAAIKPPYDVFINHHGNDAKDKLAAPIYRALNGTGLRVFLDREELEPGDFFPAALQQAMSGASLHIAIFSERYAQSPWCLAELAFILQTGKPIIPIFYKVQPCDLRHAVHGKGIYVDAAFAQYERKNRYTEKLEEWKMALHEVSFYTGDIINNEDDEQRVVKNVVNRVMKDMKKVPLEVAKHPVGLCEAVEEFETIANQCHGNVQIVGIWGMGGSGKTTLAGELYNQKSSRMQRYSFLFDIRDAAKNGALHEKQKKLLEDLGFHAPSFDHVDQGKGILASRLRSVSVLIVLDDVDHPDQLEALLPVNDSLGDGSLIIVTTREREVLISRGISAIYNMKALNPSYAKQLFCWHAFLEPSPRSGFEQIVEDFLTSCQGLPLFLKVLGGQLYGRPGMNYWQEQLEKISRILPSDIKKRLKVSYDALDEEEQEMFLDTACLFIGKKSSSAVAVWDGSGWNGLHGWERLLNKCLVDNADEYDRIKMHDHLRDLGREIANRQSPHRLWFARQIIHIQPAVKEIHIRGITSSHFYEEFRLSSQGEIIVNTSEGFRSLKPLILGLKYFNGSGRFFNQMVKKESSLVWLRCGYFLEKNLPSWLSMQNLRILQLYDAKNLQILWEADKEAPLQLRELVLDGCRSFKGFPRSIGLLKHLKILKFECNLICYKECMRSLSQEFCLLQSLHHLELKRCENLSSLPRRFGDLRNLRHLNLYRCRNLSSLPSGFGDLRNLQHLNLSDCSNLSSLPSGFGDLRNLQHLNLSGCSNLSSLPSGFGDLRNLQHLNLSTCSNLSSLPSGFGDLRNLQHLNLSGCSNLSSLPSGFGDLRNLQHLEMRRCRQLRRLPASFEQLTLLQYLDLGDCDELSIESESADILENMTRLQYLNFSNCLGIKALPLPRHIENGVFLKELYLLGTGISEVPANIGQLSKLEILSVGSDLSNRRSGLKLQLIACHKLECLPDSLGCLHKLEDLRIERSGVKTLPESFTQLINLQSLSIRNSPISELSFGLGCKLKKIELSGTKLSKISISEDCCPCLRTPSLKYNNYLMEIEALPTALETIELVVCKKLKDIRSFCGLVNLQTLKIRGCADLNALPCLAELTSVRVIELEGCHKVEQIEGLEELRSLEKFEAYSCLKVPCIINLEQTRKLREVVVIANEKSVVEHCIPAIHQKWPDQVIICTRVVCDVGSSVVKSLAFPNLSVLDSFAMAKIGSERRALKLKFDKSSSIEKLILICIVINVVSPVIHLVISPSSYVSDFEMDLGEGKWVWMGVFTQNSAWRRADCYSIYQKASDDVNNVVVERAWLMTGEDGEILESFRHLFHTFARLKRSTIGEDLLEKKICVKGEPLKHPVASIPSKHPSTQI